MTVTKDLVRLGDWEELTCWAKTLKDVTDEASRFQITKVIIRPAKEQVHT